MGADGTVLEEFSYGNRSDEVLKTAKRCKAKYGQCQAVCESTGNLWIRTADAFEKAGVPLQLANTYQTKVISSAKVKNDTVDARIVFRLKIRKTNLDGSVFWTIWPSMSSDAPYLKQDWDCRSFGVRPQPDSGFSSSPARIRRIRQDS